jgi:hypothetical protein
MAKNAQLVTDILPSIKLILLGVTFNCKHYIKLFNKISTTPSFRLQPAKGLELSKLTLKQKIVSCYATTYATLEILSSGYITEKKLH